MLSFISVANVLLFVLAVAFLLKINFIKDKDSEGGPVKIEKTQKTK